VISVVIPVKNGGQDLRRCLAAIRAQVLDDAVEIVIVDSGSTDDSLSIAAEYGAEVIEIPPESFNHGAARNLGADRASGDVLVFISQDAYPVDDHWLVRLAAPLREQGVGGAYGRQLPHDGATPPELFFLGFLYGEQPRRQRAATADLLSMETTLFSNVNSAVVKAVWDRYRFVDDIIMSEDQEWSRRVLLDGYEIVYVPDAPVRHSHNYTLTSAFKRFFDSGASSDRAYMAGAQESKRALRTAAIAYARGEMEWLWRTGQRRWIPYAALYESTKMVGLVCGANHKRIPLALKRKLSALPSYWENQGSTL
jgi:rhamnosyltransferase